MAANKLIKAIALCRVSTKGQLLDGNLEPQELNIIKAAEIKQAEVVKWWKLAVSSRKGKNINRKDLLQMLAYCKAHRSVKYLIVDEVDRFMRSINEYYWWKMEFKNAGVQLILATRPDIDPDDDRSVFDELIDVYRAEQSNNERIHKTPDKMMAKIRAGYYPSNPKTGYRTSETPGFHLPDEPNWSAMRDTFKEMARGDYGVAEGLKHVTERGLRTRNYGPKAVGGKPVDMYRWKDLMSDPYYCGVVKMSDWPETNENGLHQPMISVEEHNALVSLALNKGKRFVINRNNPDFPLTNEVECFSCLTEQRQYPRLVGYNHNNGKPGDKRKFYQRYRCRSCSINVLRENLHDDISNELDRLSLTYEQKHKLMEHLRKSWRRFEKVLIEKAMVAEGRLRQLNTRKSELIILLSQNRGELEDDIKAEIVKIKTEITEAEIGLATARDFERDFVEFTDFALSYVDNWRQNWWSLDKESLRRCKQILFPAGMALTAEKKVYTPEISLVYRYGDNKKAPEGADFDLVEGPVGLEPTTRGLKGRCSNQLSYGPI
jgi:site-specific DNA recombinase